MMMKFIQHSYVTIFISLITLIVLYVDDIRIIFLDMSFDFYVDIFLVFCMLVFITEIIVQSYSLKDYLWSFFFWLDMLSILSMPLELYFVIQFISGNSEDALLQTDDASVVASLGGRASRIGTKVGRYIKLIKIVKIGKFVK